MMDSWEWDSEADEWDSALGDELEDDEPATPPPGYDKHVEFLNRCAFAYASAAAAELGRRKGMNRHQLARAMYWQHDDQLTGLRWADLEQVMIGIENGLDPTGVPIGWEVIQYATALGHRLHATITPVGEPNFTIHDQSGDPQA
jgi:hypothetical protein